MGFQLQMTGTGNAFARRYFNNNALIQCNDYHLMIDMGATCPLGLHQMNYPIERLDGILITHLHSDHIGGLEEVAFRFKYLYQKKLTLFVPDTLVDWLWEHSLKSGLYNEDHNCIALSDYFNVVTFKEGIPLMISPGLVVESVRTHHIPTKFSYSLFINDIFYSADMVFNRALVESAVYDRNCHYILHDCQLIGPGLVHTTLEELLTLPDDIQSRTLLMHYDDEMEQFIGQTGKMKFIEQHKVYQF
ncbi:MAG: MBL fold metallo-hydrolase [Paenibacillaceae bacterium]